MPVAGVIGDIPDYANCEVARINSAYKDDDEGIGQGLDSVFWMLLTVTLRFRIRSKVILKYLENIYSLIN